MKLEVIIAELKGGNNRVLSDIFRDHGAYCINTLLKKTSCTKEDAEDILVEAVLNFREKAIAGNIEYLTSIRSYLFSTCQNMWLYQYRKIKKSEERQSDLVRFFYDEWTNILGSKYGEDPKIEMLDLVKKALSTLKEKCQQIIELFYLRNYSMEEIAEHMEFASANVAKTTKSRCFGELIKVVGNLNSLNQS